MVLRERGVSMHSGVPSMCVFLDLGSFNVAVKASSYPKRHSVCDLLTVGTEEVLKHLPGYGNLQRASHFTLTMP